MLLVSITFILNTLHAESNSEQMAKDGTVSFYHENYREAQQFLSKASEQGDASAQYYLGIMYLNGYGVPINYKEAVRLFTLSTEKNYASSQIALGVLFIQGIGVPQNFKRAAILFTQAAKQGNLDAQGILGWIYKYGVGVPENKIFAYALWNYVAAQGIEWARVNRDYMLQELSEDELYKAQDLSMNLTLLWNALEHKQVKNPQSIKKKRKRN